ELAVHHAMRRRLGVEPPVAAPPALRERIAAAIAATPVPVTITPAAPKRFAFFRHPIVLGAFAALVLGAAAETTRFVRHSAEPAGLAPLTTAVRSVPLLRDALADYRRVVAGDLPGR